MADIAEAVQASEEMLTAVKRYAGLCEAFREGAEARYGPPPVEERVAMLETMQLALKGKAATWGAVAAFVTTALVTIGAALLKGHF